MQIDVSVGHGKYLRFRDDFVTESYEVSLVDKKADSVTKLGVVSKEEVKRLGKMS